MHELTSIQRVHSLPFNQFTTCKWYSNQCSPSLSFFLFLSLPLEIHLSQTCDIDRAREKAEIKRPTNMKHRPQLSLIKKKSHVIAVLLHISSCYKITWMIIFASTFQTPLKISSQIYYNQYHIGSFFAN